MSWAGKQHPVETLVEWLAPVPLALALAWAGKMSGFPIVALVAVAAVASIVGHAAIKRAGGGPDVATCQFEPAPLEAVEPELGELLLEAKDELLELEDRLVEVEPDSRVVRLFAKPEPTPGELVGRIADFLGEGRPAAAPEAAPMGEPPVDASAALHAALANIRASLR